MDRVSPAPQGRWRFACASDGKPRQGRIALENPQRFQVDESAYFSTSATQAKPTRASVGTPNSAVWRAGSPPGKCFTYSALQAA